MFKITLAIIILFKILLIISLLKICIDADRESKEVAEITEEIEKIKEEVKKKESE